MKDKQQITDMGVNWTTMPQFNLTLVNKIAANGKEITLMAVTTTGTSRTIFCEIVIMVAEYRSQTFEDESLAP